MSLDNPSLADLMAAGIVGQHAPGSTSGTYAAPPPPRVATVGRQVHFWTGTSDGYKKIDDPMQPHAATIAYVHPGDINRPRVNLNVLDHNGNPYTMQYVELRPAGVSGVSDAHYSMNYATWPTRT